MRIRWGFDMPLQNWGYFLTLRLRKEAGELECDEGMK